MFIHVTNCFKGYFILDEDTRLDDERIKLAMRSGYLIVETFDNSVLSCLILNLYLLYIMYNFKPLLGLYNFKITCK